MFHGFHQSNMLTSPYERGFGIDSTKNALQSKDLSGFAYVYEGGCGTDAIALSPVS